MKFNLHLGVTKFTNLKCPKKNVYEILMPYFSIQPKFEYKKALLLGNLLHRIMQITLKSRISEIEYLYFHRYEGKKELSKIIEIVMLNVLNRFEEVYALKSNWNDTHYQENVIDDSFSDGLGILKNLSKLSLNALELRDKKIKSFLIDDELTVIYSFDRNLLIVGKIDLVLYKSNQLHLIELKTGRKYHSDENQIKLYGEIVENKYPDVDIVLKLWHPKISNSESIVRKDSNSFLTNIKTIISKSISIFERKTIDHIYKIDDNTCEREMFCDYCLKDDLINKTLNKSTLLSFL